MSISSIPSDEQTTDRKKVTSRKRRRNQNAEIDELASLVSLPNPPQLFSVDNPDRSLVPTYGNTPAAMDKVSVLRLTTTFLKLQDFMKNASPANNESCGEGTSTCTNNLVGLMEEAMDGFLIVLDKEANILYVSETITGYVGLTQQDVIGQNLVDITHPESATEIADCLKPSVVTSTSMYIAQECAFIISQFRQFFLRFKSAVNHSRFTTHTLVQVNGNLKVKIPPLKNSQRIEVVEPSVVGFIGECRLIKSSPSILEISIPHSTFTSTVTLDFKPISIEACVKEITGYDFEVLLDGDIDELDFIHPADYPRLLPARQYLVQTGHSVSPHFRFLVKSGDWVWMQIEAMLHCKVGTTIPQFYEYKARVLSQGGGRLKYIEQKELYASSVDPCKQSTSPILANTSVCYKTGSKPVIDSLKSVKMPESVLEPVLHARSMTMRKHSELISLLVDKNSANSAAQQDHPTMQRHSNNIKMAGSRVSTLSLSTAKLSTDVTCSSSTVQNGSDTNQSRSLSSQAQNLSPQSHSTSSDSQSPSTSQMSTSPASGSAVSSDGIFQTGWTATQSHLSHELQVDAFNPTTCYLGDQNGDQNLTGLIDLSATSDSAYLTVMSAATPTGQFQGQASPVSNYGSLMSGTSLSDDSAVSDVSSPPTVFSPEMGTALHTAVSADSVPGPSSVFSIPFYNSQASNFIPQAPTLNDFNPQIPSDFNYSSTQSSSLGTFSELDNPVLEAQSLNTSNSFLNDFVLQQFLDEVTSNGGTSSIRGAMVPIPEFDSNMDIDSATMSTSHPLANVVMQNSNQGTNSQSASSFSDLLLDSQTNNSNTCSSNPEVQDILQQFF